MRVRPGYISEVLSGSPATAHQPSHEAALVLLAAPPGRPAVDGPVDPGLGGDELQVVEELGAVSERLPGVPGSGPVGHLAAAGGDLAPGGAVGRRAGLRLERLLPELASVGLRHSEGVQS